MQYRNSPVAGNRQKHNPSKDPVIRFRKRSQKGGREAGSQGEHLVAWGKHSAVWPEAQR